MSYSTYANSSKLAERRAKREQMIRDMERQAKLAEDDDDDELDFDSLVNSSHRDGLFRSSQGRDNDSSGFKEYNASLWDSIKFSYAIKTQEEVNLKEIGQEDPSPHGGFCARMCACFHASRPKCTRGMILAVPVLIGVAILITGIALMESKSSEGSLNAPIGDGLPATNGSSPMEGSTNPGPDEAPDGVSEHIPEVFHRISTILVHYGILDIEALDDLDSPQRLSLDWLTELELAQTLANNHVKGKEWLSDAFLRPFVELYGLSVLFRSLEGDTWAENKNWNTSASPCDWQGVKCTLEKSSTGTDMEVIGEIVLADNHLDGSIPSEVGLFPSLATLDLNTNDLHYEMPSELGGLLSLAMLNLSKNRLERSIPASFKNLISLLFLDLHENELEGDISAITECPKIEVLKLDFNKISGNISEIGKMKALKRLLLERNQFEGSIPSSFGALSNLELASLRGNGFSGKLPVSWSAVNNLLVLDLSENDFSGAVPTSLLRLSNLEELLLSKNHFEGSLPEFGGEQYNLRMFDVEHNQFTGEIPTSLYEVTSLETLKLSRNKFTGSLPPEIGMLAYLQELELTFNEFDGKLPDELGNLLDIKVFRLDENQFTGTIVANFGGEMESLKVFQVQGNEITGEVPSSLCHAEILTADCKEDVTCGCCTDCF